MNGKVTARTARNPGGDEPKYVIAHGAPKHYVDGYGLVGAGAVVSLAPGVAPGKWYVEISPEDAAKAAVSSVDAERIAVLAAAKIKAGGNKEDVARKAAIDDATNAKAAADAQAQAQAHADALAKLADADAKAKQDQDELAAEKANSSDLKAQLDKATADLAAAQQQVQAYQESAAADAKAKEAEKSKPAGK